MTNLYRPAALSLSLLIAACSTPQVYRHWTPVEFADSPLARSLEKDIAAIERSEPNGWRSFSSHAYRVDGEYAETFSVACAHLLRRDPTIFLRRYLAGDPDALFCGWAGYGWSGDYRTVLDEMYRQRLVISRSASERRRIQEFITAGRDSTNIPPRVPRKNR